MFFKVLKKEIEISGPLEKAYLTQRPFLLFQGENSPLNNVRRRILILLGSLGGKCNLGLLGDREGGLMGSNGIAWDTRQHLSFAVPFQDMKPNIYLGRYHIRSFREVTCAIFAPSFFYFYIKYGFWLFQF